MHTYDEALCKLMAHAALAFGANPESPVEFYRALRAAFYEPEVISANIVRAMEIAFEIEKEAA